METLFGFIRTLCEEYTIDESHGLQHSIRCIQWVNILMNAETNISDEERKVAIYAVALHDMCDAKYTNVSRASFRIFQWLIDQGWTSYLSNVIIHIITTMSYSKLKAAMEYGEIVYPDHGSWQRIYHIVRHADLLDGYRVDRCYLYQKHMSPEMSEDECWRYVAELFQKRCFNYVSDGWIFLNEAKYHASYLHDTASKLIQTRQFEQTS